MDTVRPQRNDFRQRRKLSANDASKTINVKRDSKMN